MSICIRNWISKIHFIPSMLKSVIEAQSIIVPFPFSLLWRWYRNTSLFFIFNIRIIFWITFIVKILSELSLKIVPKIPDAVPFMQPSLLSIKLFLISALLKCTMFKVLWNWWFWKLLLGLCDHFERWSKTISSVLKLLYQLSFEDHIHYYRLLLQV